MQKMWSSEGRSPMAEMFAVNMLDNTEGGNTYSQLISAFME